MIETGTLLQQRYKIDKQIGQGGMGAVYVATDERFGSVVAIKETLCMDDNFRKAIEREARLLNSLKHSALPRVSDHFEESNGQFLVMEYIPGDDVASMLERGQKEFSVEQVLKWADQLLDALDYLHNQDVPVIHRDIKPQNLKITTRGQIILLDFGLAKGNPTDAGHQTAAKSIFGYSRNYASLEQIQGTGTDPRSDLYSLAATLYHLLTNTPPEDALTRAMSVLSKGGDPLVPANLVNPDIPRGVAGVLHRALDLNASERPSSAAEMRQMLNESEKYAYLADAVTLSSIAPVAEAFAQPTRLMPDETQAGIVKQTDIKTEVLPAFLSELTAVRSAGKGGGTNISASNQTAAPAQKRRGFAVAEGVLSVLIVGAAIAGGIYVAKPSVFGISRQNEKTADAATSVPAVTDTNAVPTTNTESMQIGTESSTTANIATPANTETARPAGPGEKPAETTKNSRVPIPEKPKSRADAGDDILLDGTDLPGETTVTRRDENGKVTTMRVTPDRLPPNMPAPPNGMDPFPRGFDPGRLTPEQRRRLQRVMRDGQPSIAPLPRRTPY